jgi:hypothetical protein
MATFIPVATGGPAGACLGTARRAERLGKARRPVGARAETSAPRVVALCTDESPLTGASPSALRHAASSRRSGSHTPTGGTRIGDSNGAVRNGISPIRRSAARPHRERGRGGTMSTRTPAEDRHSRSTRSAIETVRATDLSTAVLNVLWEDAEFVLSRAVRGERLPPLLTMTPTSLRPVPDTVARLENGYALRGSRRRRARRTHRSTVGGGCVLAGR